MTAPKKSPKPQVPPAQPSSTYQIPKDFGDLAPQPKSQEIRSRHVAVPDFSSLDIVPKVPEQQRVRPEIDWTEGLPTAEELAEPAGLREAEELRLCLEELSRRSKEPISLYEPLTEQRKFLECGAPERVMRGGNRSGKTLTGAYECALACMGLKGWHGRYPQRDGRFVAVGSSIKHCANVMWKKLARPGPFKIIRDLETGTWRAYRPWEDAVRRSEVRPAPPLIPERMIRKIGWENKALDQPQVVYFTTGWELHFFSADAKPPYGWDIDGAWMDEEVNSSLWYTELCARLLDRSGLFYWTATPQAGTRDLYNLHVRCQEQADLELDMALRTCVSFNITLLDNPHIEEQEKKQFQDKLWGGDEGDIYQVRVLGEFAVAGSLVYPEFRAKSKHSPYFQSFAEVCPQGEEIPAAWTRVAAIDPGRQVCAILFAAIPPPDIAQDRVYLYDEIYLRQATDRKFAQAFAAKVGKHEFWEWIVDKAGSRVREIGSGRSILARYRKAINRLGLKCQRTGGNFSLSTADVKGGIAAVHDAFEMREDNLPRFVVLYRQTLEDTCPHLIRDLQHYCYRKDPRSASPTDDPLNKDMHMVDCLRYLAQADLIYRKPRSRRVEMLAPALLAFREKLRRRRERRRSEGEAAVQLG